MSKNTHLEIPFFTIWKQKVENHKVLLLVKFIEMSLKVDKANAHKTCRFKNNIEYTGQHEWI